MGRAKQSKTLVAKLFDQSSFPIYLIDDKRRILYCNDALVAWLGAKSDDDVVGLRCDYHSANDPTNENALVAGLCPPPECFDGQSTVGQIANRSSTKQRSAEFVSLASDEGTPGILVLGAERDLVQTIKGTRSASKPQSESQALHATIQRIRRDFATRYQTDRVLGVSSSAKRIRNQITLAMASDACVLIQGPRGSGRERIARTIHHRVETESNGRLIPIACELLAPELIQSTIETLSESEARKSSSKEICVLLTEVDQLPLDAQARLVSFLNDASAIRFLATSGRPLGDKVATGEFREDLAFALSTLVIDVPPLSQRREDIPVLAQAAVEQLNAKGERQRAGLTSEAIDELVAYPWPNQVDELFDMVRQAFEASKDRFIQVGDLPERIRLAREAAMVPQKTVDTIELESFLAKIERDLIERAIQQADGNKSLASKLLGMNRAKLLRRLEQLGLSD